MHKQKVCWQFTPLPSSEIPLAASFLEAAEWSEERKTSEKSCHEAQYREQRITYLVACDRRRRQDLAA